MRGKKVKGIVPKGGTSTNPIQNNTMAEKLSTKEVAAVVTPYAMHSTGSLFYHLHISCLLGK